MRNLGQITEFSIKGNPGLFVAPIMGLAAGGIVLAGQHKKSVGRPSEPECSLGCGVPRLERVRRVLDLERFVDAHQVRGAVLTSVSEPTCLRPSGFERSQLVFAPPA